MIERVIKRNLKKIEEKKAYTKSWKEFQDEARGKKVFLFGVGAGAEYYWQNYKNTTAIDGFLDNDERKQGFSAGDFIQTGISGEKWEVSSPQILQNYPPEQVVVMVTNLNQFDVIIEQLCAMGLTHIFSLLLLEADMRTEGVMKEFHGEGALNGAYRDYAKECLKEPVQRKKMVFHDKGNYSGHGRQLTERLLEAGGDLDLVWLVSDMRILVPEGVRLVYEKNLYQATYEMETAGFWVYDYTVFPWLIKREGQIYIQTKHWASITLKSFGFDEVAYTGSREYRESLIHSSEIMDYILVGSEFDERTCRSGFGFQGKAIYVGSPRSDVLFQETLYKTKICQHYQIQEQQKLLLYAPTWRRISGMPQSQFGLIGLDFGRLKGRLEDRFGGEWKILLRLHPDVVIESTAIDYPEYVVNVSYYSDSQELVAASDMLITDYSSIMFEPAFVGKPVFLYAPDRDSYINKERPLLIEYDSLPFPAARTEEQLWKSIQDFEETSYQREVSVFLEKYGVHEDGHAAQRAVEFIQGLLHGQAMD